MSTSIPSAASTLSSHQQQQYHQNQVFNWLDDLNLTHLFHKFIDNGYEELGLCVKIGESDLNAIGIQELRERKAILQAVRQLQFNKQQRSKFPDGNGSSSSKTLPGIAKQPSNSFLKALSPTRRRCPEIAGTESSSADPRSLSQLGAGNTWDHEHRDTSGEVELQEIRYHFQPHSTLAPTSLSSAHVPPSQNASTVLSSFFRHKKQQQQHHHNSFNELIQNSRRNGGNGLGHQQQQKSILIVGGRTLPFHPTGKDFVSADDIHDSTDVDDDNGDYSECTDLDLILSAQRTCSSHINHTTTRGEQHSGGDRFSPLVVEHCDCGFFEHQQNSSSKNYQQTEDDEPFYESVSPQPPALKSRPHGHPIPTKYQVPLPLPPGSQLGLNYTNGVYKLENNNSQNCAEAINSFGDNKASSCGGEGGPSAYNNDIQTHANFILRSQLRDHIIHAKINLAQLPDETTLRAMAAKYASELSYTSSPSAPNNPGNAGAIGKNDATRPNITPINSSNWAAQGLPLLEFQQHVLQQLREIWLEERRKLVSDIDDCGINLLSPNSCSSSANFFAAANPSSIFSNDSSSGTVAAGNLAAEFQFPSCGSSTANNYVSGDQQQKQQHNQVGGYFNPSSSSPDVPSPACISVFSSHFSSNTSTNRNKSSMNNGGLEKCVGGSNMPALNSSEHHRQRHDHTRGTPKQSNSGNANNHQQQRHQYLEPVIITNSPSTSKHHNQLHKYQPPPPLATISGFGYDDDRQSYTPGIYQPSSCLRDKDEIYDYIPPRGHLSSKQLEQISPLSKRSGGSRFQSTMSLGTMRHHNHSKCLSNFIKTSDNTHETSRTLLHHHQHQQTKDKTYGFFREVSQTSPRRNNHNFSTIRLLRGTTGSSPSAAASRNSGGALLPSSASTMRPTSSSMSSYTISGSCSSSNSNNSNGTSSSNSNNAYGFPSFNHIGTLTSEIEDYSRSPGANTGCRTLANLSKLSRRLGLNRFFRPLRHNQQGHHPRHHQYHHQNSSADRQHYFTSTDSSYWVDTGGGVVGTGGGGTLGQPKRLLQSQPLLLTSPDSSAATSSTAELSSPNGSGSQQRVPNTNEGTLSSKSKASGYQGLVSLPSNERIIETINRLKYEELQRRKERIAQEHRMIIREIRESMSHRNGSSQRDGPSSVYYVTNEDETGEDGDERGYNATDAASLFRLDSSSSLKIPHAYENIGTSSGSEFGNNGTLEKREKTRHNKGRRSSSSSSGRNKFGFGSVGNLEESCKEGDLSHSLHSKAVSSSNAKAKSTSGGSRRCTASDQNLNDGFKLEEGASGGGEDNELENENEFGPQSLFITTNRVGVGHSFGTVSSKEQPRKGTRIDGGPHLDRRIIGAFESTLSSRTGTGSSNGGGVISGQEISGSGGNSTNNGWQLDGNTVVAPTSAADDTAVLNNRSSYGSTTSRASTSSESFSEIFARNLKRTFKSNQAKAKVMNNEDFLQFMCYTCCSVCMHCLCKAPSSVCVP